MSEKQRLNSIDLAKSPKAITGIVISLVGIYRAFKDFNFIDFKHNALPIRNNHKKIITHISNFRPVKRVFDVINIFDNIKFFFSIYSFIGVGSVAGSIIAATLVFSHQIK